MILRCALGLALINIKCMIKMSRISNDEIYFYISGIYCHGGWWVKW